MNLKDKRVLIISSRDPSHSADLGNDMAKALMDRGSSVDFLSMEFFHAKDSEFIGNEWMLVKGSPLPKKKRFLTKLLDRLSRNAVKYTTGYTFKNQHLLHYPDEKHPPIKPSALITAVNNRQYDLVITLFWYNMLSSVSLMKIYKHLKCPILVYSVDMAPMTGGCFYFGNCLNFKNGCGNCPILGTDKPKDASAMNYAIKHKFYKKMPIVFMGNKWMCNYAEKSGLFNTYQISEANIIISPEDFTPPSHLIESKNATTCTSGKQDNPAKDDFNILLRSSDEPRKGNLLMIEIIRSFLSKLTDEQKDKISIITIGDDFFYNRMKESGIKIINKGFVCKEELVRCYQQADCFMSCSTDDAGPSMINQSMMCGTPVVAFDNGAAVNMIEHRISGFKAEMNNTEALANSLLELFNMNIKQRESLSKEARLTAIKYNSPEAFADAVELALSKISSLK